MIFFNTLTIPSKVLLAVVFLTGSVAALFLTGEGNRTTAVIQTNRAETLSFLVEHAGMTLQALQKERGLSAGFLVNKGMKYRMQLVTQVRITTERAGMFASSLEQAKRLFLRSQIPDGTQQAIKQSLDHVAQLQALQRAVMNQKITLKEALNRYAVTNTTLLDALVKLVHTQRAEYEATQSSIQHGWWRGGGLLLLGLWMAIWGIRDLFRRPGPSRITSAPPARAMPQPSHATVKSSQDDEEAAFDRLPRLIGLHAGSITACASAVVQIRSRIHADATASYDIATHVAEQTTHLVGEISSVKQAIGQASDNVMAISTASQQLSANIGAIATATEQASANISTVASAAEEITANIAGVNHNLNHVGQSLQSVSQATQDMTASLVEVRKRCLVASQESNRVNQHAIGSRSIMVELSESAGEIGNVVELINSIAEQTNMLALNASIEAAGAGEAGKGFAVVANEVKELARQTSKATELIAQKANNIQQKTFLAAEANTAITSGIGRINQGNADIAQAVDEQAKNIRDIADTMDALSETTDDVTRNSQELNMAAQDVAKAALEAARSTTAIAESAAEGAVGSEDVAAGSGEAMALANTVLQSAINTEKTSKYLQAKMAEAAHSAALIHSSAAYLNRMGSMLQQVSNALYISQLEAETTPPPFNIRELKNATMQWQSRLEQGIYTVPSEGGGEGDGNGEDHAMASTEACSVCDWFTAYRDRFGTVPAFDEATEHHKQLHDLAQEVHAHWADGNREAARQRLDQYDSLQEAFFQTLDTLYLGEAISQQEKQLFFPWRDDLRIGIAMVDDDHKKLIGFVNQLHRAMKDGGAATTVETLLNDLALYTEEHFAREEALMARHRYPGLEEEKAEHRTMVAQLKQLAKRFEEGDFSISMDIMAFARVWLNQHILGTDSRMTPFFADRDLSA